MKELEGRYFLTESKVVPRKVLGLPVGFFLGLLFVIGSVFGAMMYYTHISMTSDINSPFIMFDDDGDRMYSELGVNRDVAFAGDIHEFNFSVKHLSDNAELKHKLSIVLSRKDGIPLEFNDTKLLLLNWANETVIEDYDGSLQSINLVPLNSYMNFTLRVQTRPDILNTTYVFNLTSSDADFDWGI